MSLYIRYGSFGDEVARVLGGGLVPGLFHLIVLLLILVNCLELLTSLFLTLLMLNLFDSACWRYNKNVYICNLELFAC